MGLMTQKAMAQQGSERINEFLEESKLNKAQAKKDEEARIFAQNHPDPTKEEEGLVDPLAMFTPLASDVVDVDRAIGSALEGDWGGAALGMVAAVPVVGDAAKAAIKASKKPNKVDAPVNLQKTISEYDATWSKFEEIDDVDEWQATVRKHVSEKRVDNPDVKTPELEESARQLSELKITREEHLANVDKYKPVRKWTAVPREPSNKTIVFSLNVGQRTKGSFVFGSAAAKSLGVQKSALSIGDNFSGRLDITAYKAYDTWVVSGTSKGLGGTHYAKAIHYKGTDGGPVKFIASQKMGERIGKGEKEKTPYATVSGVIKDLDPDAIRKKADELLDDPEWTQVGFDPRRQGAFYVRGGENSGMAVVEADEVIQVGALLLARKAVLDPTKKNFNKGGLVDKEMQALNFNLGGDVTEQLPKGYTLEGGIPKAPTPETRPVEAIEFGGDGPESLYEASKATGIPWKDLIKFNGGVTKLPANGILNIPADYAQTKVQNKPVPVVKKEVSPLVSGLADKVQSFKEWMEYKVSRPDPVGQETTATNTEVVAQTDAALKEADVAPPNMAESNIVDSIHTEIRQQENGVRAGWKEETGKWLPHPSAEGGLPTIGYGHKFATQEEADAMVASGGITEEQALTLFQEDMNVAESRAKKAYEANYKDRKWDSLDALGKLMLTEIAFNTGTLIENGVYNWPTLTKAIHDKDYGVASSQLNRTYTRKDGKQISLRGRTNALKAVYKTLLKDAGWTKDNSQASVDKTDYKNMIT